MSHQLLKGEKHFQTSKLANKCMQKALLTCVVYTRTEKYPNERLLFAWQSEQSLTISHWRTFLYSISWRQQFSCFRLKASTYTFITGKLLASYLSSSQSKMIKQMRKIRHKYLFKLYLFEVLLLLIWCICWLCLQQ